MSAAASRRPEARPAPSPRSKNWPYSVDGQVFPIGPVMWQNIRPSRLPARLAQSEKRAAMVKDEFPGVVSVIVEVPKGSRNKYEFDHESGRIKLDRVLFSSVHYPADYGYIEGTLAEDGDEVDTLVLIEEPTFPGCLMQAKPVGMLRMRDEKGADNKVLAVPLHDPRWSPIGDIHEIPAQILAEVENFFLTYKKLETKVVVSDGWEDAKKTQDYLIASIID